MTGNAVTFPFRKENKKTIQRRDHTLLHREVTIEHEPHYKQGITKHYTENIRLSNTNPNTNKGSQNTTQKT